MDYKSNNNVVYSCKYHVVWCPKYRRSVLVKPVDARLKTLIRETAEARRCEVIELEVMPDHVHLFLKAPPTLAPQHIANQVKGFTSHTLREEFPDLKSRLPSLWSRSYYVGSAGAVSADTIQKYIEQQKES